MRYAPRLPIEPSPPLLILAGGGLVIGLGAVAGAPALLAAAAMAVAAYAVLRPGLALAGLLLAAILLEDDKTAFLGSFTGRFYDGTIVLSDLLFATLIAAVAIDLVRRHARPQLPGPFTAPLVALIIVALGGIVTGHYGGATAKAIVDQLRCLLYLAAIPFLYVNVAAARGGTRKILLAAFALAGVKAVEGLVGFALGKGHQINGGVLTFIGPTPNWLFLILLLTLLAALLEAARSPTWAKWLAPLAFAALMLAFRRSFYIAGAFGFGMVLIAARGARGRRFAVAAGAAVVAIALGGLLGGGPGGAVAKRALSLDPAHVQASTEDRYRIDERKNVVWQIRNHPVTGLGLGVGWSAHYPLSFEYPGGREYTHIALLWYWLKLGVLGALVYLWLMGTAIWASYRVWRGHPDGLVRAAGLALMAAFIGLMFTETTQSFTGVESRLTIVEAATFGWLAIAMARAKAAKRPAARALASPEPPRGLPAVPPSAPAGVR